jgi:predicted RNase H-like HicB family nuclease
VTALLREAIAQHIELLREMGEEIPVPSSHSAVIQVRS